MVVINTVSELIGLFEIISRSRTDYSVIFYLITS